MTSQKISISYAITVCNEAEELKRLLTTLVPNINTNDEIIVQVDTSNTINEVYRTLNAFTSCHSMEITSIEFPLNGNFAEFKNNLIANCSKDYIFQIDADELPMKNLSYLKALIAENSEIEVFGVPRCNTVEGITTEHLKVWKWHRNSDGFINFPDFQSRIFKNNGNIRYKNKVHEVLTGMRNFAELPREYDWSLIHNKQIARQEKQNKFYAVI